MNSRDDICGDALLGWWCLSDDVRPTQQERKSALLDLVWGSNTE